MRPKDAGGSQGATILTGYYPVADKSPFSTFHQYYHFGKSFDEIEAEIAEIRPDVVGISSLFTPYYREVLEVAARVKKRLNIPVVVGGSHASAVPESLLASANVDFVISGEGEKPFVEFLRYLKGRKRIEEIPNLAYKKADKFVFNPSVDNFTIDELPFPDLRDLSPAKYTLTGKPMTFMITSRSCPHKCSFVRSTRHSARIIAAAHWKMCSKKSNCAINRAIGSSISRTTT